MHYKWLLKAIMHYINVRYNRFYLAVNNSF